VLQRRDAEHAESDEQRKEKVDPSELGMTMESKERVKNITVAAHGVIG
jgi:hypothetical protein